MPITMRTSLAFDPSMPVDADHGELRRAREGDERAFTSLYRRHSAAVYRFAWLLTGSESLANDVTQETFIELLEGADGYDPARGSLAAYLCGIARFRAYRVNDRRVDSVADVDEVGEASETGSMPELPLDALERSRAVGRLYDAIRRLPAPYREVLILVELQEMAYADAAAIAGIELGTVRSRLSRAKARLAEMLRTEEASR
jgi:RNA polymerase sigma-70 factor (ECF subfamily)